MPELLLERFVFLRWLFFFATHIRDVRVVECSERALTTPVIDVTVWDDKLLAQEEAQAAHDWFSQFLQA